MDMPYTKNAGRRRRIIPGLQTEHKSGVKQTHTGVYFLDLFCELFVTQSGNCRYWKGPSRYPRIVLLLRYTAARYLT